MLKSLRVQVLFVIAGFAVILIVQAVLSRASQILLISSQEQAAQSAKEVAVVYELDRNVIDLQRNLLIYSRTASESAQLRFSSLISEVAGDLVAMEALINRHEDAEDYEDLIRRLRSHLDVYEDSFADVVIARRRQADITELNVKPGFERLKALVHQPSKGEPAGRQRSNISPLEYHAAVAESLWYQYMAEPDARMADKLEDQFAIITSLASGSSEIDAEIKREATASLKYISQLGQLSRGYVFNVNVVMAGSANEVLYLTRALRELVSIDQMKIDAALLVEAQKNKLRSNLAILASAVVGLLIAYFLLARILRSIRAITQVFRRLHEGEEVLVIPGGGRSDEIGELAEAASAFSEKSGQLRTALSEMQAASLRQELLNQALSSEKEKAEQAVKSKSMFLANMSHEIRTPMNGVMGLINQVLKSELGSKQREYLNKANYSSQVLMGVINDILDFSKIEAGKLSIERVAFSTEKMIDYLVSAYTLQAQQKNLNFSVNVSTSLPAHLLGDPLRINQVLLNLCSNAVKFTEVGGFKVNISFRETAAVTGLLTIGVVDSGFGMSEQEQGRVFDSFTQADGSTSRKFGGTGLGLAIVKELVELMDGSIDVSSTKGQGSEFLLSLPVGTTGTERALRPVSADIIEVHYLADAGGALLENTQVSDCGLRVTRSSRQLLGALLQRPREKTAAAKPMILIDLPNQDVVEGLRDTLSALTLAGYPVGCVMQMQPLGLADDVRAQWRLPVLRHPFSPAQLQDFLAEVWGGSPDASSDASREPAGAVLGDLPVDPQFIGHVLVVEDSEVNQVVICAILSDLGLTYDVADDGLQAVAAVASAIHYDLVLMDIQMPNMDGYEATRFLRDNGYADLIICGLSANAMKEDYEKAYREGMNAYLAKPVNIDEVVEMVSKYLVPGA
jgi:signal transduction histidine kinase/CheY-like chemotaxis protein